MTAGKETEEFPIVSSRNKELASCGHGVLSVTLEEQRRIQMLLRDGINEKGYLLEEEQSWKLSAINKELQKFIGHSSELELKTKITFREKMNRLQLINKLLSDAQKEGEEEK